MKSKMKNVNKSNNNVCTVFFLLILFIIIFIFVRDKTHERPGKQAVFLHRKKKWKEEKKIKLNKKKKNL